MRYAVLKGARCVGVALKKVACVELKGCMVWGGFGVQCAGRVEVRGLRVRRGKEMRHGFGSCLFFLLGFLLGFLFGRAIWRIGRRSWW